MRNKLHLQEFLWQRNREMEEAGTQKVRNQTPFSIDRSADQLICSRQESCLHFDCNWLQISLSEVKTSSIHFHPILYPVPHTLKFSSVQSQLFKSHTNTSFLLPDKKERISLLSGESRKRDRWESNNEGWSEEKSLTPKVEKEKKREKREKRRP